MSMFINEYSFSDFVTISEGISPKIARFGTNIDIINPSNSFTNSSIVSIDISGNKKQLMGIKSGSFYSSWCSIGNGIDSKIYWVGIDKNNEVGFAVYNKETLPTKESLVDISNNYTMDRTNTKNTLVVFGSVMYVILQIAKSKNITSINFEGFDVPLDKFYTMMTKNKSFILSLEKLNWRYNGKADTKFTFTTIEQH